MGDMNYRLDGMKDEWDCVEKDTEEDIETRAKKYYHDTIGDLPSESQLSPVIDIMVKLRNVFQISKVYHEDEMNSTKDPDIDRAYEIYLGLLNRYTVPLIQTHCMMAGWLVEENTPDTDIGDSDEELHSSNSPPSSPDSTESENSTTLSSDEMTELNLD